MVGQIIPRPTVQRRYENFQKRLAVPLDGRVSVRGRGHVVQLSLLVYTKLSLALQANKCGR